MPTNYDERATGNYKLAHDRNTKTKKGEVAELVKATEYRSVLRKYTNISLKLSPLMVM